MSTRLVASAALGLSLAAAFGQGCAGQKKAAAIQDHAGQPPTSPDTNPLDQLSATEIDLRQLIEAVDSNRWTQLAATTSKTDAEVLEAPGGREIPLIASGATPPTPDPITPDASLEAAAANDPAAPAIEPAPDNAAVPDPQPSADRAQHLAGELAQLLSAANPGATQAIRRAAVLVALDIAAPGSVEPELRQARAELAPGEARAFDQIERLLRTIAAAPAPDGSLADTADPRALAEILREHADKASAELPFAIAEARLCSSVSGFGRYTPLPTTSFIHGGRHRALLYVSLKDFAETPVSITPAAYSAPKPKPRNTSLLDSLRSALSSVGDRDSIPQTAAQWSVDVSQSLALYQPGNARPLWELPEETLTDHARERRRDFYLVRRIELPTGLALGDYQLKITIRDRARHAIAESIIPIRVVAKP